MMVLHFGRPVELTSFDALVDAMPDREFERLTRSTVPLLAWWRDEARVRGLENCLGLEDLAEGDAWVEYAVSPHCTSCGGRGKSSYTDVLLKLDGHVVAIEAKHSEKLYATVGKWLGSPGSDNKRRVLHHWLSCCIGSTLTPLACRDLVYQMVHRTASACHVAAHNRAATPHVVHVLFGSEHVAEYVAAVDLLARTLASTIIRFAVVNVRTGIGVDYDKTKLDLDARGPDALREALVTEKQLFVFGSPDMVYRSP